jgi:hypothetical protein
MNLHGLASGYVGAVNPLIPVSVRTSTGPSSATSASGQQLPGYATPGAITASISGTVLTVTAVASGALLPGVGLADTTSALLPGTTVTGQLTGSPGGMGTYSVSQSQTVASEAMTTSLALLGQIQPITWGDLQQMDGINLGGVRWKIYVNGELDGVVRPELKGGDLITISTGRHQGVWLVVQVLEQYPDWCCAAITLQDGS